MDAMAVNLTPQYHKAQEEYRRAATPEDELKWLQVMWKELPKHKASEKVQVDLKQKISHLKKELEGPKKAKVSLLKIPRQGAGRVMLLGGPNAGKSQLLAKLTRATPEIAPYPFTTRIPLPGMMPWQDVSVQLIDTPPITKDVLDPSVLGMIRGADLCLLLIDLGGEEGLDQCQEVVQHLNSTKTRLGRETGLDEDDVGLSFTRTFAVPNKIDADGAPERLEILHELLPLDFVEYIISAQQGTGVETLRDAIYQSLNVVRAYTKLPNSKVPDLAKPFTLPAGGTVLDLAGLIHADFVEKFKFARLWGVGVHDGEVVKGDHVLHDKDVVELHT